MAATKRARPAGAASFRTRRPPPFAASTAGESRSTRPLRNCRASWLESSERDVLESRSSLARGTARRCHDRRRWHHHRERDPRVDPDEKMTSREEILRRDEEDLSRLGYAQLLLREMGG